MDKFLQKLFIRCIKASIRDIKKIRQYAEKANYLDEQWYLDYLDELNKLSIDQDRPSTK